MKAEVRRRVTAVIGAVLVGVLPACAATRAETSSTGRAHRTPTRDAQPAAPRLTLTWRDEFTGPAGSRPDPGHWVYDLGGEPSWGNKEWEYYTDRPGNVALDGHGSLAITARREKLPGMAHCRYGSCDITSGRITTNKRFAQRYGRWEARIKVPDGQGMWPAFWLLGAGKPWPDGGEIDVMEIIGSEPATTSGTLHGPGYGDPGIGKSHTLPGRTHFAKAFHVFAVDWTADRIDWSVDGKVFFSRRRSQVKGHKKWVFDQPFHVLLNLAVGGEWPGPPDRTTRFPATMLVDYVRVYGPARSGAGT